VRRSVMKEMAPLLTIARGIESNCITRKQNITTGATPIMKDMSMGMTDAELERDVSHGYSTGVAPWAYWTSEVYSIGKCLRHWTKYPTFLPLFVYSDHGVALHSNLLLHELKSQAEVHLTWNQGKAHENRNLLGKEVLHIMHPWISYRRLRGIKRTENPKGTLVFFTHGTDDVQWEGHDSAEYFAELKHLPKKFQPVVLCLHMHDVNAGYHKKLRRYGLPIVTLGNPKSIYFVDRFYDLVSNYSYTTSQNWGSHVAYCVEFGVPFFYLGDRGKLINISNKNLPDGIVGPYWDKDHERYEKKAESLFRKPVDSVTDEQRLFVETALGFDSQLTREQVSWVLWRNFFCCWRQWAPLLKSLITFNLICRQRTHCHESRSGKLGQGYK